MTQRLWQAMLMYNFAEYRLLLKIPDGGQHANIGVVSQQGTYMPTLALPATFNRYVYGSSYTFNHPKSTRKNTRQS